MIICFNCSAETKDQLDRSLATGCYRDYGEVIAAAIRNQVLMESEIASKGAIVFGDIAKAVPSTLVPSANVPPPEPPSVPPALKAASQAAPARSEREAPRRTSTGSSPPAKALVRGSAKVRPARENADSGTVVPSLFRLNGFAPGPPPAGLADLPPDMWLPGQPVPLDRWMLGQQNRLLPAKANIRAIFHLFIENKKGLPISETANRIATSALALGDYLAALDAVRTAGRDDALATAFPTTGEGADKGCVRYANQFVVYQNSRGELSGLMVDLKLINVVRRRKERLIVPTQVAWEFATLANSVLDRHGEGAAERFSAEERALLIRHIAASVPVEAFAYRAILQAVRDGDDTPDTMDGALKKAYVAEDRAEALSQSFLASQRSGAVSRMSDLGLIERQRTGVRVSYAMTDAGLAFLKDVAAAR